jgi:hypothetical protein
LESFYPFVQAPAMRHNATQRTLLESLEISLREPAGLVCAALLLALVAVIAQIAAVW